MGLQAITAAALTPHFLREADLIGRRFGPQAGLEFFLWRSRPDGIGHFLRQNGYAHIADMRAASSGDVNTIIRDPWVLRASKSSWDAIFLYGPGFTPDIYDAVLRQIEQMPNTRGSRIDLVNTARLAQLSPGMVYMMEAITNPGRAGAAALGVDPRGNYMNLGNAFMRQMMPGMPANLFAQSGGAANWVASRFGGPVG
jgi:hypothetical protein